MADDEPQSVWVASTPTASDGVYRVEVTVGPDVARILDRAEALEYAAEVTLAGMRALHDARVIAAFRATGMPEEAVALVVRDLRNDRAELDGEATRPLILTPGVAQSDGAPFVRVSVDGLDDGQWAPGDCFRHASHVLGALAATGLDQAVLTQLLEAGVGEGKARAVIEGLADVDVERDPS